MSISQSPGLNHILSFLSPDSLLRPTLLELSRLLKRPTLDLVLLRKDAASPPDSYEGYVYTGPVWIVRITRSELRQVRSPEYIGYRLTSLVRPRSSPKSTASSVDAPAPGRPRASSG